jgi:hypothetical protein
MANAKPYYTTDDLIESVKRRISYPLSQNTFQYSDIVAFLNEEMQLSAVPTVKMEHEEYFVYKKIVPLVDGISRYEIPDRAIGMALRDLKYSDTNGNFYDMTRIAPDDKAFFQQSNGSNQTVAKFYVEGNEIVLTPLVQAGASGMLNFFFFLRPNALVRNNRSCIIQNYQKDIIVDSNSNLQIGDQLILTTGNQSPTSVSNIFTNIGYDLRFSNITAGAVTTFTTTTNHGLSTGDSIYFSGLTANLVVGSTTTSVDLNGINQVTVTGLNTFTVAISTTNVIPDTTLSFTSITATGTPTTVTTTTAHGLTTGDVIFISGITSSPDPLNGAQTVTVTGTNTFTIAANVTSVSGVSTGNAIFFKYAAATNQKVSTVNSLTSVVTTVANHNIPINQSFSVTLYNVTGLSPNYNGVTYSAISLGANTFSAPGVLTSSGTGGYYVIQNQFVENVDGIGTAKNLTYSINDAQITNITAYNTSTAVLGKTTVEYKDISATFEALKGYLITSDVAFSIDSENLYVNFDQLPATYTDPETDVTSAFYVPGTSLVDFLQTNPGHRTYTYDIKLLNVVDNPNGDANVGVFLAQDLQTYSNNSSGGQLTYYNIKIGDYICLQNECIIPQIPPELHNALAERAASRVLMAIGDVQGYQISQAKLAEMNKMQETLIASRVESSVIKVFNRYSLLRLGKSRFRRRY